jgi:hypothetical protein
MLLVLLVFLDYGRLLFWLIMLYVVCFLVFSIRLFLLLILKLGFKNRLGVSCYFDFLLWFSFLFWLHLRLINLFVVGNLGSDLIFMLRVAINQFFDSINNYKEYSLRASLNISLDVLLFQLWLLILKEFAEFSFFLWRLSCDGGRVLVKKHPTIFDLGLIEFLTLISTRGLNVKFIPSRYAC